MNFNTFRVAVAKQFSLMQAHSLFRVNVEKDDVYATYLTSFPEGTNPLYRERTEHDCSCCKSFIRALGNVVSVDDKGKMMSIWDVGTLDGEEAYTTVADKLSKLIHGGKIIDVFLHDEPIAGANHTFEEVVGASPKKWDHFHANVSTKYVRSRASIASALAEPRETKNVLLRGLTELTVDAVDTVLDLIAQNSLYRGEEHKFAVESFGKLKRKFDKLETEAGKEKFAWLHATNGTAASISRIRNTAIGTLLIDLSAGVELEQAVKSFEKVVAPANYKRPTALVTPKMIENAKAKISELGLLSALERRHAVLRDISVNDILFADRNAKKVMSGNVFDDLIAETGTKVNPKTLDKIEEVPVEKFLSDILPRATSLEVLLENRHTSNFVSLVAPCDPTAGKLFKWDNNFSWSYNGELADSDLRKAVQERGGRVDGVFRFSHSWNHEKRNASLMDLHVFMPGNDTPPENGVHDHYGNTERVGWNHRRHARSGGVQDVDYTDAAPVGYVPVENITFPDLHRMPEGRYVCKIHNWSHRAPTQGGFKAEIEFGGEVFQYDYDKPLKNKEWVTVAEVTLKNGVFTIKHHLPEATSTKLVWGLPTQSFHKVNVVCLSPNHWESSGSGTGNKHFFFMLDGCKNDASARGFYNEFLKPELNEHRKVFEMVGSKTKPVEAAEQLSGLGFSSTQRNSLVVKVKGSFTRTIRVMF